MGARAAEWFREHGGASIVVWAENEWYSHHQPKVGGALAPGTIRKPKTVSDHAGRRRRARTSRLPHRSSPSRARPSRAKGSGRPPAASSTGVPAIYETMLRPSAIHTSYVVGVAWMDTKLLKATLYSGSQIPGGGPYTHTAPISPTDATSLDAAFNAGFLMSDANGGYYTDDKTIIPLRTGAASFVVYKNGSSTVGQWGRDVTMGPNVVVGPPEPGPARRQRPGGAGRLQRRTPRSWGETLGGGLYVWRSGLGVTANGALVYVGGPGLDIADLANILVRAGAVRAMELDINTDWVNYSTYQPSTPGGAATPANGTELLAGMTGTPGRYFQSWWARDFITMSAAAAMTLGGPCPGRRADHRRVRSSRCTTSPRPGQRSTPRACSPGGCAPGSGSRTSSCSWRRPRRVSSATGTRRSASIGAFLVFCVVASGTYLVNDVDRRRVGSAPPRQAAPARGQRRAATRTGTRRRGRPHRRRPSPARSSSDRGASPSSSASYAGIEHRLQHPPQARARDGARRGGVVLRAPGGRRRRRRPRAPLQLVPRLHLVRRPVRRDREALRGARPPGPRPGRAPAGARRVHRVLPQVDPHHLGHASRSPRTASGRSSAPACWRTPATTSCGSSSP